MKIFLVDDHVLFREGLISLLTKQPNFTVVGYAHTPTGVITELEETQPDFVLLDLAFDDGNGLEILKQITASMPSVNVVVLALSYSDEMLIESLRIGAKGYLMKNQPFLSLMSSLSAIERGELAITRKMTRRIIEVFLKDYAHVIMNELKNGLTKREIQVLELLGTGASNREIATELVISEFTVKNHVHKILAKTFVKNRREAAMLVKKPDSLSKPTTSEKTGNSS